MEAAAAHRDDVCDDMKHACAGCGALEPLDGRLQPCTHVICASCLADCLDSDGKLKCPKTSCKGESRPAGGGDGDLRTNLLMASQFLYPSTSSSSLWSTAKDGHNTGSPASEDCYVCDTEPPNKGTHTCMDCTPTPALCETHAEKHTKRRAYAKHRVVATAARGKTSQSVEGNSGDYCQLHVALKLEYFCRTCERLLCSRCLIKGHAEHDVISCQEAAEHELEELGNAVSILRGDGSSTSNGDRGRSVDELLSEIALAHEGLRESAENASETITELYDRLRDTLKHHEGLVLNQIDKICWSQQEMLHKQRDRLADKKLDIMAVQTVYTALCRPACSPCDIIRISRGLSSRASNLSAMLLDDAAPCISGIIATELDVSVVDVVAGILEKSITTHNVAVDLANSSLVLPDTVPLSKLAFGELTPCNKHGQPVLQLLPPSWSGIRGTSRAPDGEVAQVKVTRSRTSDGQPSPSLKLAFNVGQQGTYSLEISVPGESLLRNVSVEAWFDAEQRSARVTLSDDCKEAKHNGAGKANAIIVGSESFTSGVYAWKMTLENFTAHQVGYVVTGVATYPLSQGYDADGRFGGSYGWESGEGRVYGGGKGGGALEPWRSGDELEFTLDLHKMVLSVTQVRTNCKATIQHLKKKTGQALRYFVYLYEPGARVRLRRGTSSAS